MTQVRGFTCCRDDDKEDIPLQARKRIVIRVSGDNQVCSITIFFLQTFSQHMVSCGESGQEEPASIFESSKMNVFIANTQSRFVSVVLKSMLGAPRPSGHT